MPDPKKVKHVMVERDINQADLARRAGMSAEHVSKVMRKGTDVRESTLKRICRALSCKAEDIW